jgi:hypothetical protein
MAQAPQGFGEAVGIRCVQAGIEAGVVLEQAVENIGRFPRSAGDELGREDADAVTDVGVDGDGLVVMGAEGPSARKSTLAYWMQY